MPLKTGCAELIEELSEDARRLRAVNTIVVGLERIEGHNTDAPGFDRFLRRDAGFDPAGRTALVFGAGGAARACALALARGGLRALTVALRDPERAAGVRETLEGSDVELEVVAFDEAADRPADLIVNATPLGARGERLPLPSLGPDVLAVDLLYRSPQTPLQAAVRAAGGTAFGGIGMLLQQAAMSFELWTGQPAPLEVMSAAALAELAEPGPSA
jgi:shikimate dehydrogenase